MLGVTGLSIRARAQGIVNRGIDFIRHACVAHIVDDSELNRAILYEILKDDFYLLEATNGQECIDYIKQYGSGISLILLDIIMPEIDGFDVLQWMEQEKWLDDIPVILISSEDSANIINKGFAMGASDYIKRPFDYRIVYRRVYNIIKLYAKQKRLMACK